LAPTVGIAATGFCYPGGILQLSIGDISKFFLHRQDQQISRLPTAAAKSLQQILAGSNMIIIDKVFINKVCSSSTSTTARTSQKKKSSSGRDLRLYRRQDNHRPAHLLQRSTSTSRTFVHLGRFRLQIRTYPDQRQGKKVHRSI
jgi:hypothetical protein